jgi:Holliday junction resolvasome RuvABC endonuclease subunit
MKTIFIGIDPSLSSPGICVLSLHDRHMEWHVMAQYKHKEQRKLSSHPIHGTFQFDPRWIQPVKTSSHKKIKLNTEYEILGETSSKKKPQLSSEPSPQSVACTYTIHVHSDLHDAQCARQMQRQTIVAQHIASVVDAVLARFHPCVPVIGVEHYLLHVTNSDAVSVMCEIGGMVRYELTQRGLFYLDVNPSSIKSHFVSGAADKLDMWKRFQQLRVLGSTSLYMLLKFDATADRLVRAPEKLYQPVKKRKKPQKDHDPSRPVVHVEGQDKPSTRLVHKPIEDMVDSFALVLFLMHQWKHMNHAQQCMFFHSYACHVLVCRLRRDLVCIIGQYLV